jgi:hypothetical protein
MKDLLDRYLAAVARGLPDRQRADIVAELRDELLTKVELREEAAGRPLERDELEVLLLEFGHPLIVAGRYRKVQHLVGPEIYPMWWYALKITLAITAAIYLVAAILQATFVTDGTAANLDLPDLVPTLLIAFGTVTAVAVVIERLNLQRFVYQWRPRQLPPVNAKSKSPFERVVEIGMEVVFILWWTGLIQFRNWIPPFGALTVELAPVFQAWFWPVLGYSVFEMAMNLVGLLRPGWVRLNAGLSLARSLAGASLCAGLLQAGHWLNVSAPGLPPETLDIDLVQMNFDLGFKIGLVVTVAGFLIKAAMDAHRLWRVTQDAKAPLLLSVL